MEHYFNNQSVLDNVQIYRNKLAVLYAVTKNDILPNLSVIYSSTISCINDSRQIMNLRIFR